MRREERPLQTALPNNAAASMPEQDGRPLDVSERFFANVRWIGDVPVARSSRLDLLHEVHARLDELIETLDARELRRLGRAA
jgi:hypothetical protein